MLVCVQQLMKNIQVTIYKLTGPKVAGNQSRAIAIPITVKPYRVVCNLQSLLFPSPRVYLYD